jgi:hypothetical protein
MPADETFDDVKEVVAGLEEDLEPWLPMFRNIKEYVVPDRGLFTASGEEVNKGQRDDSSIYDATATRSLQVMAAGLQGGLTSPAREWFRLGLEDEDLAKFGPVREWLADVEKIMYDTLRRSNFYQEVHGCYIEQGSYGTAALLADEHDERVIRFRLLTAGTYAIGTDDLGRVDSLSRHLYLTPMQMYQMFGKENVSHKVRELYDNKSRDRTDVVHVVYPRKSYDDRKIDSANMPWGSHYYEATVDNTEEQKFLRQGGYREFPFLVPRWEVSGDECWGRSPAMQSLDDTILLQEQDIAILMGLHKEVDPPMMGPSETMSKLDTRPGAQNVGDIKAEQLFPLYQVKLQIDQAVAAKNERREDVARTYYNDLFLMLANAPEGMTATEVIERQGERLLQLGPVLERQQDDFHDPLIDRLFRILDDRGEIPPAPPEIQGQETKVDYISLLALAQRRERLRGINETAEFTAAISQFQADVRHKFNGMAAVDEVAKITGVPENVIRDDEEVAVLVAQEQAAQEAAQRREALGDVASAAKDGAAAAQSISDTDINEPNALTQLLGFQAGAPA